MADSAEIRILGPVRVLRGPQEVDVGGGRQLALFALLAVHAGESVSTDRIIDELWGAEATASARRSVQSYVSRLRRSLGEVEGVELESSPGGYRLRVVEPAWVDSVRMEAALAAVPAGSPDDTLAAVDCAVELWGGQPLSGLEDYGWALAERGRLERLELDAQRRRSATMVGLGRLTDAVALLEVLVAAHPHDEDLVARLARCRYESTGSAAALRAIAAARTRLRQDLGIDPGPALADLEHQILDHDRQLDDPARSPTRGAPASRDWSPRELPGPLAREPRFGFVGRTREMARLDEIWRDVVDAGRPQVVELVAEAPARPQPPSRRR